MNCQLCQKYLEFYLEGRLPEGIKVQVDEHLKGCIECYKSYYQAKVAEKVIAEQKGVAGNPFAATRIMAHIEKMNDVGVVHKPQYPVYQKLIAPALLGISIFIAIVAGVLEGSMYKSSRPQYQIPVEMLYINDAAVESVNAFAQ